MIKQIEIAHVLQGDIVRFKSYALRVEAVPVRKPGSITLHGRINIEGSPLVTKHFMTGRTVTVER